MLKFAKFLRIFYNNCFGFTYAFDLNALAGSVAELDSFIDLDIELDENEPILIHYNLTDKTKIKEYMNRLRTRADIKDRMLQYMPEYMNRPKSPVYNLYGKMIGGNNCNYYSKYIKYKNKYLSLKNN